MGRHERGVVLVLVLMITMVISLISLQIALNAKEHIRRSQSLRDRADAFLQLRTVESQLQFDLLTNNWVLLQERRGSDRSRGLNFQGVPFRMAGVSVAAQDLSGLYVLPQPGRVDERLGDLFVDVGIDSVRAESAAERLTRLQSGEEGIPLQDLGDLVAQAGLDVSDVERLRAVATVYPLSAFNPLSAPTPVLKQVYSGLDLDNLLRLRRAGQLSRSSVSKALDSIDEEFTVFSPGPVFRLDMESTVVDSSVGREMVVRVDPYDDEPVVVWSVRRKSFLTRVSR